MKAIGENVIVLAPENIINVVTDGLNLNGNSHTVNGLRVASVGEGVKSPIVEEGGMIIASKIAVNPQNIIEFEGNRYLKVQYQYIFAAQTKGEASPMSNAELEQVEAFKSF